MNIGNQMKHKPLRLFFFLVACLLATTLNAQELDSLKAEVQSLKEQLKKVEELEYRLESIENDSSYSKYLNAKNSSKDTTFSKELEVPKTDVREQQATLTGQELINDDFPGSWPLFGTDFRMKLGGKIKADFLYDIDGTDDPYQFLMATIPVEGTPQYGYDGYINYFARESRFSLDIRRVTPNTVPLRAYLEADFWTNDVQLRLRQAYITAGNFTIGQTWTTLSLLETITIFIDFAAGDALYGGRSTQIRYSDNIDDNWKYAVAVEMLNFMGIENPDTLFGKPSLQLPLLAGKIGYYWSSGLVILGAEVAQLHWDGAGIGPDASGLQASVVFGGRKYFGKDDFATWNISYGVGSGENVMAFAGSQANAVLTREGTLETMPAYAFVLGFMHRWNDLFSSNIGYAYGWLVETPESRAPLALKEGGIGHLNLFFNPIQVLSTGIEYMYGSVRTTDGSLGRASRIQFMVMFEW